MKPPENTSTDVDAMMRQTQKIALMLCAPTAILLVITLFITSSEFWKIPAILLPSFIAYGIGYHDKFKGYQYTLWIITAIVCGMVQPNAFLRWGSIDLRNKWLILIVVQVVMFGMGTQMSIKDFKGIKTMGKGVMVGILCQFSIMPLTGYLLTRIFNFEPEIAAGIILIGSCSSGLASNVMVFIAKANLTLSVTLTAVATLVAPVMTPLLMKLLAGTYVEIHFLDMFVQIIKIVLVPIGSALLFEAYSNMSKQGRSKTLVLAIAATIWVLSQLFGGWRFFASIASESQILIIELLNFMCGSLIVGLIYFYLVVFLPKAHAFMPKLSMFGIIYFTTVTTAASRENILSIGILLLLASIIHNSLGYTIGFWISRLLGLSKQDCKTVALEVGLQNGGMASGLAGVMGKLATMGLASAVFSPWMNISGSVLANFWKNKSNSQN